MDGREVDDRLGFEELDDRRDRVRITKIGASEIHPAEFCAVEADRTRSQIVEHADLVVVDQPAHNLAPDKAVAARHQDPHDRPLYTSLKPGRMSCISCSASNGLGP